MTKPKRILIVEDEVLVAICLELELKQAGYDICQSVATGEKAVAVAEQQHPDIILMDISLAGEIDGVEAAQQIQSQVSTDISIIFMTGYPDKATEERAKEFNPLGYIVKPVRIQALQTLIDSVERE